MCPESRGGKQSEIPPPLGGARLLPCNTPLRTPVFPGTKFCLHLFTWAEPSSAPTQKVYNQARPGSQWKLPALPGLPPSFLPQSGHWWQKSAILWTPTVLTAWSEIGLDEQEEGPKVPSLFAPPSTASRNQAPKVKGLGGTIFLAFKRAERQAQWRRSGPGRIAPSGSGGSAGHPSSPRPPLQLMGWEPLLGGRESIGPASLSAFISLQAALCPWRSPILRHR